MRMNLICVAKLQYQSVVYQYCSFLQYFLKQITLARPTARVSGSQVENFEIHYVHSILDVTYSSSA